MDRVPLVIINYAAHARVTSTRTGRIDRGNPLFPVDCFSHWELHSPDSIVQTYPRLAGHPHCKYHMAEQDGLSSSSARIMMSTHTPKLRSSPRNAPALEATPPMSPPQTLGHLYLHGVGAIRVAPSLIGDLLPPEYRGRNGSDGLRRSERGLASLNRLPSTRTQYVLFVNDNALNAFFVEVHAESAVDSPPSS